MDCSSPGSSVHGTLQARILEWVTISYSMGSSQSRDWTLISCIGRRIFYHCATWKDLLLKNSGGKELVTLTGGKKRHNLTSHQLHDHKRFKRQMSGYEYDPPGYLYILLAFIGEKNTWKVGGKTNSVTLHHLLPPTMWAQQKLSQKVLSVWASCSHLCARVCARRDIITYSG